MKIPTFDFQSYFDEPVINIEVHQGGLTNENFIVTTATNQYFFRRPKAELADLFNRRNEATILKMVKNLDIDLPYIFFDESSGIKISHYYPNLLNYDQYQADDKLQLVTFTLKKLHSLNQACGFGFDYLKKLALYKRARYLGFEKLENFSWLEVAYSEYQGALTVCHNDCVNGNLLFDSQRNYLIDYEYAGDNYAIFDVTSFTTENDLDPLQRGQFYNLYYGSATASLTGDLQLFEKLHHYLWCHWALMMYAHEKNAIYYEIALNKYCQLTNYQTFIL